MATLPPEPPPLTHYLPPQLWAMLVGYLAQAALIGTALVVARIGLNLPADVLSAVAQIEVAAAVALVGGALGSGLHALGARR
jgi:hypothetical protein